MVVVPPMVFPWSSPMVGAPGPRQLCGLGCRAAAAPRRAFHVAPGGGVAVGRGGGTPGASGRLQDEAEG